MVVCACPGCPTEAVSANVQNSFNLCKYEYFNAWLHAACLLGGRTGVGVVV